MKFVECQGTTDGLRDRFIGKPSDRIESYRDMYENCTIVLTNLEIVYLRPAHSSDYDLSFFENIREVHGYVLVASNFVSRVPLTSLRVIRGRRLFKWPSQTDCEPQTSEPSRIYSLFVAGNINASVGLRSLELPSFMGE